MLKETPNPWELTEEVKKKAVKMMEEKRKRKEKWLNHHQKRHPIFPSTGEKGMFKGLFGYSTAVGVHIFPYYKTESGIYFYESKSKKKDKKESVEMDIDSMQKNKLSIFYTPKSFLGDEPVAEPGVIPHHEGTPPNVK